jgi:hypothetical protein
VRLSSISPQWQLLGLAHKIKSYAHSEDIRENRTVKLIKKALPIRRKNGVGEKVALGILMGSLRACLEDFLTTDTSISILVFKYQYSNTHEY